MKNTTIYRLRPQFVMKSEDIEFLNGLPENLPETKLTAKQKERVSSLYYQYISNNQVYKGWGRELFEVEQKENWPSGDRVKRHEAQRMVLGWLAYDNEARKEMNAEDAADYFHSSLNCRECNNILTHKIYERV